MDTPPRVLIVDDIASAREMLGALLSVENYETVYLDSGKAALEKLDQIQPDVLLMDVMMPELDGFEVCRRIRSQDKWQHLPIILVTALDSNQDLARGIDAGADDFLHKPVNGIELRARVRSMLRIKRQFDALEAALQMREDLAHMIVHDMRSPLTAIFGYVELLAFDMGSPEAANDLEKLRRQTQRLNAFVNDLLMAAKMEHNRLLLNATPTNLNELVRTIAETHEMIAVSRAIELHLHLPAVAQEISVDATLFQRAIDNLLSNALKFAPFDSTVTIAVEYHPQPNVQARLSVIDEGPGIPPHDRERIFNKYEVAAMKQRSDAAVGLGLAFSRLVVDAHHGRIYYRPNQPTGSIFTIEI